MGKDKVQAAKSKKVKKGDLKEFQAEDPTVYFELFKQLKDQFYKEKGQKSTLETLKESLGGAVLKDVTFFYQKLNKKSTETIVRTLKEFYDMLSHKEADFFKALITSYSIIHEKLLTTEFERDVFLHVLRIDDLIIKKNRDAIRQHFKIFYPVWYLMQHEILGDIQAQAKRNLLELFPDSDKHIAAFFVCHQNYLNMISTWLTQPAKQFKDINLFLDDDDCERVHSRLLGLTFRSMEASVILLGEFEDREEYTNKLEALLKFDEPGNLVVELFNRYKKDFSLRAEIASFYSTLIKEDVEDFENKQSLSIIKNFLANLDVKEPLLQQVFWQKGLVEDMLPGMKDKFDQLDMPKVYKRIQTILEVGGLSIGIDFFKNVNSFLLQSPLFDFRSASSSKKFCGPLGDNFKLIEGFVKAYYSTLELDSCKFIMKDLIQTYFDFAYHVLVEVALKTRADIKKGTLYNDAELTDPLKKSMDSFFEKLTELLLISPLELYLERNSPDNQSEFAVGINNYKFLPKLYAKFMQRLVECAEAETISNNQDLLERSFGKFAQSVAELAKDKRKFESFLILIDGLASEKITPTTPEAKSVYGIVARLFDNSSKFLEAFASEKLVIENLEKQFSVETYSNFKKYLSNILASNSDLNLDISARIVPKVVKNLVTVLTESLDEYFEMFEDESLRNDIIQTLFSVYYLIVDWQAKKDQLDLQALSQVFGALNKHVVEISNTDEVSLGSGKNKGSFIVVVSALTPYTKISKLADLWKLKGQELKEASVAIQEATAGVAGFKATCKNLIKSKEFVQVATGVVKKFLLGRTLQMINLYDVAWRLSEFVPEENLMKIWPQTLHANNNKDEYVRYKLAILDQLYSKTSPQSAQKQAGLVFSYLNESKSFAADTIICKVEKFFSLAEKSFRNSIVLNFGQVLKDYLAGSADQSITEDNRRGVLQAFGFYLTRFIQEEDLTEDTCLKLFGLFMTETNFKGSLHRGFFWNAIRVVAESCGKVCKLPPHMQSYLNSKDRREVLYALLASPSCLQIVLNYDLKKYFFDFNAQNLLPAFQDLAQRNLEEFTTILREILDLAVTTDIQYVYGLKTILMDFTRSDSVDTEAKQSVFLAVMEHLRSHQKAVSGDNLSSFIELTSNVTNYFHESCFKLVEVLAFKVDLKTKIRSALKLELETTEDVSVVSAEPADYSGLSTQDLLFDLTVYLSICRHSRVNGLADLCPFMFAAVKPDATIFPGVKREVLLCLLFRLLNSAIEDNEFVKITDRITQIEESYREGLSLSSFGEQKNLLLVSLLEFLRKVITIIEMFSKDFEESIQGHIMDTAISKVTQLKEIRGSTNDHFASYGCGFDELLVEIAETLARFSLTYSGKISEDQLYILLDCGVPVVQKSAWMILHDLYTNRISPSKLAQDDEEFEAVCKTKNHITPELLRIIETRAAALEDQIATKNPKKKQGKQGSEILEIKSANEGLDLGIFSFALSWIAIMTKSKTNRLEGSQDQKYLEAVLNNFSELYSGLLTSIFKWINDLKIPGKALEKKLDSMEIREIPLDWTEYIDHDTVFTLLLHTFFKFTSSFPKFLRQWMNFADKRYTSLALFVVRQKISNMILDYEIAEIEAKEPVWSSEEFSIVSFRNTREIEAVYNKENAKLSMKFYLPDSYPVELLQIEMEQKLNISELKQKRWMLSMKKLLTSFNTSIVDGLIQWKNNIDQEFEGIEECPICYDIVHASTKSLPTMACKNCNKKFHPACVQKWIKTSSKNECPLCKSQLL